MTFYSIIQVGNPLRLECTNAGAIIYKGDGSLDNIYINLSRAIQRGDWGKDYNMQESHLVNFIKDYLNSKEKLEKYNHYNGSFMPSYWFLSPYGSLLRGEELMKYCRERYL